jgi:tryptophan synthase alpha chain
MTTRYANTFAHLHANGQGAFIPFTLLGWPNKADCLAIIQTMVDAGASCLELGLPFSDPVADGPIIQTAAMQTLAQGFSVSDAFELIATVRANNPSIPIGLLVYANMVLARGVATFCHDAAQAGVDGVLIADVPPEMAPEFTPAMQQAGLDSLFIISPLTTPQRMAQLAPQAGGFLYAVSRLGITGTEERYDDSLASLIQQAKATCHLPVCVGFGISTPKQAQAIMALGADGVITGSGVLACVSEGLTNGQTIEACLKPYLQGMVTATHFKAIIPV